MAKLVQLHISGIRSFAPSEEGEPLDFDPLTLIVGPNGCGKTSIIEAINYVCCGELMGAKRDFQDFINDPKLCGSSTTKGRIKLQIVDSKGNEVTVFKNITVNSSKKPRTFKSKPSEIITRSPGGEISRTFDDATNKFCKLMDVTPAILNNVIFCHQENSTWPLSEGNKLKEKFDEIFETEKYKDCLIKFKTKKKLIESHIDQVLRPQLVELKVKKEHVRKQKKLLQDKEKRIATLDSHINAKNEELAPVRRKIDEIRKNEKTALNLEKQILSKEATRSRVIEEQKDITKCLREEFQGDDRELEHQIKSLEFDRQSQEKFIKQLQDTNGLVNEHIEQIRSSIEKTNVDIGTLNQAHLEYSKTKTEIRKLLRKVGKWYWSNEDTKATLKKLKSELASEESNLQEMEKRKEKLKEEWQEDIDKMKETRLTVKNNIATKTKELQDLTSQRETVSRHMDEFVVFDEDLKRYEEKIGETEASIGQVQQELRDITDSRRNSGQVLEEHLLILQRLEDDKKILQDKEILQKKIENELNFIQRKQEEWEDFKSKHSASLSVLFGDKIPRMGMAEAVLAKQKSADEEIKALRIDINIREKEVTTLETLKRSQMEQIAKCQNELENKENRISQVCHRNNFDEVLENSVQKRDNLLWDKALNTALQMIFENYIIEFEKEIPNCPVCETKFGYRNTEVETIIAKLRNELDKRLPQIAFFEEQLKKEEVFYNKLQQLKVVNEEIEMYETEIMLLKTQLGKDNENLDKELTELGELKIQLEEPEKIVDICRGIITEVPWIDQNATEVEKAKRDVKKFKEELRKIVLKKTKQQIEEAIDSTRSQIEEIEHSQVQKMEKIKSYKERLQELTQTKLNLSEKKNECIEALRNREHFAKLDSEAGDKIDKLEKEIAGLQDFVNLSEAEIRLAIANSQKETADYELKMQRARDKRDYLKGIHDNIQRLQSQIDNYLEDKLDQKLEDTKSKLKHYKMEVKQLEDTKTETLGKIAELTAQLQGQQQQFRELEDNVILRSKRALDAELRTQIESLKLQLVGNDTKISSEDKSKFLIKKEVLEKELSFLEGELYEVCATVHEVKENLSSPECKYVLEKYQSKYYEMKIAENVVNDLTKYVEALERAIFEFHLSTLAHINESIKQLWRCIYRGNDVDYIEIQSVLPEENAKKQTCAYRIVLVKRGVELDLRKRASVGQKNLACLIIRLALAEALSSSCGILALDEPTTNLDRENVRSLCEALSRMVGEKKRDGKFQLLVITHDEEFVDTLSRTLSVGCYYRITRDGEGFSRINKEYF